MNGRASLGVDATTSRHKSLLSAQVTIVVDVDGSSTSIPFALRQIPGKSANDQHTALEAEVTEINSFIFALGVDVQPISMLNSWNAFVADHASSNGTLLQSLEAARKKEAEGKEPGDLSAADLAT